MSAVAQVDRDAVGDGRPHLRLAVPAPAASDQQKLCWGLLELRRAMMDRTNAYDRLRDVVVTCIRKMLDSDNPQIQVRGIRAFVALEKISVQREAALLKSLTDEAVSRR
ncbi:MAG TPA: hypothetical protein VM243_08625 [Phycisphaerae bacterium]|nr:hypothetical protein [Phycisphaerae bacterium]